MIIAFTGAGISKASGLSTFDEMPGVRQKLNREYLDQYPDAFRESVGEMHKLFATAQPNDAHHALAEYKIPVITMNVDGLHERAGSHAINLHGTIPSDEDMRLGRDLENRPVLYGEIAPNYPRGIALVETLQEGDFLLVIGASEHTVISNDIRNIAARRGAQIIEIKANAEKNTRIVLERLLK